MLSTDERRTLLHVARTAIEEGLERAEAPQPAVAWGGGRLDEPGACFVTLKRGGELRGCIGSLSPARLLVEDVAHNAWAAACADPRFPRVEAAELTELHISISVLGPTEPVEVATEVELLGALRPGTDGLILRDGEHRSTFLPAVWESLPEPRDFLAALRRKAGLAPDHWSTTLTFERYGTESFGED